MPWTCLKKAVAAEQCGRGYTRAAHGLLQAILDEYSTKSACVYSRVTQVNSQDGRKRASCLIQLCHLKHKAQAVSFQGLCAWQI